MLCAGRNGARSENDFSYSTRTLGDFCTASILNVKREFWLVTVSPESDGS